MRAETTRRAIAGFRFAATLLFLLRLSCDVGASDFAPLPVFYPAILGDVCTGIECGKGTCRATKDHVIPYVCECEEGWRKLFNSSVLGFLPCVIPNCTVDFSCTQPSTPAPAPSHRPKFSILDPCSYTYCGEGECVRTSDLGHRCDCRAGYANLLNVTIFPCLSECFLKSDCSSVGLFGNQSSSVSPATSPGSSKADLGLSRSIHWIIILALFGFMIFRI